MYMGANTIHTKGHHTCRSGRRAYILDQAPFRSVAKKDRTGKMTTPYLGEGCYFWDDNIKLAEWWGKVHYNDNFNIIEVDMCLQGDKFLDLVGSRQDLKVLQILLENLNEYKNKEQIGIGEGIELLKRINSKKPGVFEYDIFRAVDLNSTNKDNCTKFDTNKKGYLSLDPAFIICYSNRNNIPLESVRLVK